jgi:hypothetical protein
MFGPRLRSLTTLYLATVYGLVGLTGESLHYLAMGPVSTWSRSSAATIVYYHTHGPDFHGHFHRHTHHGHHSHVPSDDLTHQDRAAQRSPAVAPEQSIHEPHACPLLTLVSTLKLGHAGPAARHFGAGLIITKTSERGVFHLHLAPLDSLARGPPTGFAA